MSIKMPYVCVLTGRQMAAIGSVAIAGAGAGEILRRIFEENGATLSTPLTPSPLRDTPPLQGESFIRRGTIVDGQRVVDEVVVGCEGPEEFIIHCHGNPLLAEQIVKLAQSHGAQLVDSERFAFTKYQSISSNLIEAEAQLAMQQCATLTGVKILHAQIGGGLSKWAQDTLNNIHLLKEEDIQYRCQKILKHSQAARYFIEVVKIVITGPPNAGKSTLLNALAGQQQTIVSDMAGTTRDWVSVACDLKRPDAATKDDLFLRVEFIDTAGMDAMLAKQDQVDLASQELTQELLRTCDLILYVQDAASIESEVPEINIDTSRPVIAVYNKSDLIPQYQPQASASQSILISAHENIGIDRLVQNIFHVLLKTDSFPCYDSVAFTDRQRESLRGVIEGRNLQNQLRQLLGC